MPQMPSASLRGKKNRLRAEAEVEAEGVVASLRGKKNRLRAEAEAARKAAGLESSTEAAEVVTSVASWRSPRRDAAVVTRRHAIATTLIVYIDAGRSVVGCWGCLK